MVLTVLKITVSMCSYAKLAILDIHFQFYQFYKSHSVRVTSCRNLCSSCTARVLPLSQKTKYRYANPAVSSAVSANENQPVEYSILGR